MSACVGTGCMDCLCSAVGMCHTADSSTADTLTTPHRQLDHPCRQSCAVLALTIGEQERSCLSDAAGVPGQDARGAQRARVIQRGRARVCARRQQAVRHGAVCQTRDDACATLRVTCN